MNALNLKSEARFVLERKTNIDQTIDLNQIQESNKEKSKHEHKINISTDCIKNLKINS